MLGIFGGIDNEGRETSMQPEGLPVSKGQQRKLRGVCSDMHCSIAGLALNIRIC